MSYVLFFAAVHAAWWYLGRKERAQNKEKERQAALWKQAGIDELFYRREYQ